MNRIRRTLAAFVVFAAALSVSAGTALACGGPCRDCTDGRVHFPGEKHPHGKPHADAKPEKSAAERTPASQPSELAKEAGRTALSAPN